MKKIIFDSELHGHHLEYIHHLHENAVTDLVNEYFFVIPNTFHKYKKQYSWKESNNVSFIFLSENDTKKCNANGIRGMFNKSFIASKVVKNLFADEIFFIYLMPVIPFLSFFMPSKTIIKGIIYNIYLYSENKGLRGLLKRVLYYIITKKVSTAYILNDIRSVNILNKTYKTQVFQALPDPISEKAYQAYMGLADNIGIEHEKVFLHFGHLKRRKGTLDILKAINLLPNDFNASFIFAGIIDQEIKAEFLELKNKNKDRNIIVIEEYCSADLINDLCHKASCLLIPYYNTGQSSGVLGHAAAHHLPVIGPKENLLGYLIDSYQLGITIDRISPFTLSEAILKFKTYKTNSQYIEKNSIDSFLGVIFNEQQVQIL